MRRSIGMALAGIELAVLGWWFLSLQFETGFDSLQYQRMAGSIVRNGVARWVTNPLSYVGIYPGSDSSGVPFLAGAFSLVSGTPMAVSVLVYDGILFIVLGLGLFILVGKLTRRSDLGLLAVLMGSFAYGFSSALSWSLDERSFNVSVAPLFIVLLISHTTRNLGGTSAVWVISLCLVSAIMFVSHLSFLLLLPFCVVVPLVFHLVRSRHSARRKRSSSILYFGLIGVTPFLLLTTLSQLGILSSLGLATQLESSALFIGDSPAILVANAIVFVGTRIGPVNLLCAAVALLWLASRPILLPRNILAGAILLAGLLGLPIVLYSKDLLIPTTILVGVVGIGGLMSHGGSRRLPVLVLVGLVLLSSSLGFNAWNTARTSRAGDSLYWALPGVTSEAQTANLWMSSPRPVNGCSYGNNAALLQQVSIGGMESVCNGLAVDFLMSTGTSAVSGSRRISVYFTGVIDANPTNWFVSPEVTKMTDDFARLPFLNYGSGMALLRTYDVHFIVVDLRKPYDVPAYGYQGTLISPFFAGIWQNLSPLYETSNIALFRAS